jgi:hypothetical protein
MATQTDDRHPIVREHAAFLEEAHRLLTGQRLGMTDALARLDALLDEPTRAALVDVIATTTRTLDRALAAGDDRQMAIQQRVMTTLLLGIRLRGKGLV